MESLQAFVSLMKKLLAKTKLSNWDLAYVGPDHLLKPF